MSKTMREVLEKSIALECTVGFYEREWRFPRNFHFLGQNCLCNLQSCQNDSANVEKPTEITLYINIKWDLGKEKHNFAHLMTFWVLLATQFTHCFIQFRYLHKKQYQPQMYQIVKINHVSCKNFTQLWIAILYPQIKLDSCHRLLARQQQGSRKCTQPERIGKRNTQKISLVPHSLQKIMESDILFLSLYLQSTELFLRLLRSKEAARS